MILDGIQVDGPQETIFALTLQKLHESHEGSEPLDAPSFLEGITVTCAALLRNPEIVGAFAAALRDEFLRDCDTGAETWEHEGGMVIDYLSRFREAWA